MKENKNITYSAADIQHYLEGKLSPQEMYAIEKAALDDEFLAEAIEGYSENKDANWQHYLQQVKDNFSNKKEETKIVALNPNKKIWWRAAASILVIAGLAIVYNLLNKPKVINNTTEIAKVTPSSKNIEDTNTIQNTKTTVTNTIANINQENNANQIKENKLPTPAVGTLNSNDIVSNTEDLKDKQATTSTNNTIAKTDIVLKPSTPAVTTQQNTVILADEKQAAGNNELDNVKRAEVKIKSAPSKTYQFISQVVGPDNSPLPFANISIKSENFGTYADVKGNFRITSPDSLLTVQVKSVGYLPKYYTLNAVTNLNKIVLAEDKISAANEVVIKKSNSNATSRKATFLKDTIINVEPKDGWENYGTYVSNNFEIPDDILKDKNRHGEVEVSFNVTAKGAITDIKIDKTSCNGCDEDAVKRAIQQGPQWKTKQGKAGTAKIRVQY